MVALPNEGWLIGNPGASVPCTFSLIQRLLRVGYHSN